VDNEGYLFLTQAALTDKDTWFSIHRRLLFQDGRQPIFPGNAHKSIRAALEDANYWALRGQCVYLAQGAFRNAGEMGRIYPKAIRQEPNLVACKNLYMDMDVKESAYPDHKSVMMALKKFSLGSGLPYPTIIVASGNGGVHVYWTLDTEFTPSEFRRMAAQLSTAATQHGVIFDRQCTNDPVRLMRVPGTWNFKGGPDVEAKPVTLLYCNTTHIPLKDMQKGLAQYKIVSTVPGGTGNRTQESKSSINDDLSGGMKSGYAPANIDVVATFCPFIKETLDKAGANLVGEKQWHLVAALSCHCDDPSKTVHRLCEKGPQYSIEGTEEKLGIAQRQREARETIGPPKCAIIALERTECATCPHLALGTTPLSVQYKQPHNRTNTGFQGNPSPNSVDLPFGYFRSNDDQIYLSVVQDKGGGTDAVLVFQFRFKPGSVHIEAGKAYQFVIDILQAERWITKRFDTSILSDDNAFAKAFANEGLLITIPVKLSRMFVAKYLSQLLDKKENLIDVPAFGWSQDYKGEMGFAFAGKFFSPAGEFKANRPGDGVEDYRVVGGEAPWRALADILLVPERPDLCCMGAATFASPLVDMTGHAGLLLGLVSGKSGIGKSTALLFGQAAWSKPVVGGLSDTVIYTFAKCAMLRHLPLFYDEIKGEKQMQAMTELAFQLTGGREKGRANRMGAMRQVKEFRTLCGYCANGSIVDAVRQGDKGTDASWLRMFEMQAIDLPKTEKEFAYAVNRHLTDLHFNFGSIGLKYAEFLGKNHIKISKALVATQQQCAEELGADPKIERYWIDAIATILLGAHLANKLGFCKFPIDVMKAYMYEEFRRMKQEMADDPSDFGTDIALRSTLGAFLNEKLPRNTVILNRTQVGAGKPSKDIKIINLKPPNFNWGTLEVQLSGNPLILRITDSALTSWCKRTGRPKSNLQAAMKKRLNAKMLNVVIGAGTDMAGAKENSWVIEATGTMLEETLEYIIAHGKFEPNIP
jgi:Domain of unknown function (DUF927)